MTSGVWRPEEAPRYLACVWTGIGQIGAERPDAFPPKDGYGSGFLVARGRVLTAAHVLAGGQQTWKRVADGALPMDDAIGRDGVFVFVDGRVRRATLVAWDKVGDLALLDVGETALGLRAPIRPAATPAAGAQLEIHYEGWQDAGCGLRAESVPRALRDFHVNGPVLRHPLGLNEGMSGGPVFVDQREGGRAFIGVARLGGVGSASGAFTVVAVVRRFLEEHGVGSPSAERSPNPDADRRGIGEALELRIASDLEPIVFHTRRLGGRWVKAAHRPLSMRETWLLSGRAFDDEPPPEWMPGHVADGAAAARLVAAARERLGAPVRLPTAQELGDIVAAKDGRGVPRCAHEPARFVRYDQHEGLLLPPPGIREWAMERRAPVCLDRNPNADDTLPPTAQTARLVFDLEAGR